jgi:glycosyltransferase involved in cell wall biosynthesis
MCKVSVVVIAYNIECYIKKCLESIINQTFKDLEIIVVNDGSTDHTINEIKNVAAQDSRILIIDKNNGGAMEARKTGFTASKGEFILFVDGDDWIHEETIEMLLINAIENESDIVLYNYYLVCNDNLTPSKSYTDQLLITTDNLKSSLLCYISPNLWTKFLKRSFLIVHDIDFPGNISYAEDLATGINIFMCNPKISILDKHLYFYFQREDSITKSLDQRVFDIPRAVNYIRGNLINKGLFEKYKEEFDYLAYTHIFYNKIICTNHYNEIHKKINDEWKCQKINIKENKYFTNLRVNSSIGLRIKMYLFNYNHSIGLFYLGIRKLMGLKY